MKIRSLVAALVLVSASSGCWFMGQPSKKGGSAATGATGSGEGKVDAAAFAPPEGLPDMRPIIGFDPDHWGPAFMPKITQQMSESDVMDALGDFEVADASDGEVKLVTVVPKTPADYAGLRSMQLSFHTAKDGSHRAYGVDLKFSRSARFQQAFKQYIVHLARMNFGPISDEEAGEKIITIIGDDGHAQIGDQSDGVTLNITFPIKRAKGKGRFNKPPKYSDVETIDEDDFAPPKGQADARSWLGFDPDHWSLAFLPRITQGMSEDEVFGMFDDFKQTNKPKTGEDHAFVTFVPKDKKKFPGLVKVEVYSTEDEGWKGRGVRSIDVTIEPRLLEDLDYRKYLGKLGELNFGGKEKEEIEYDDGISAVWMGDHSSSAQFAGDELKLTFPRH